MADQHHADHGRLGSGSGGSSHKASESRTNGSPVSKTLWGFAGNDRLVGGRGNDYLDGGSGNDSLYGRIGDDKLNGGSGNDLLSGGRGNDHLKGGSGNDTALFNVSQDGNDAADLGGGSDVVRISASGAGQVRLTFTSAEGGNGSGRDAGTMANQDGGLAVRLQAENGSDALTGPLSRFDDEGITFVAARPGLSFDVRDLVSGVARGDQFKVVSLGTAHEDTLRAEHANKAYYVNAGMGDDRVSGGSKSDFLVGGGGNDVLSGQAGDDRFIAGGGNDVLLGGAGDDAFIFNAAPSPATNLDTIRDFGRGDDTMQLDDAVFLGLAAGALSSNAFALATAAAEADDRVIYDQGTGNLFFDPDGGSRDNATPFAMLSSKASITAADFFVV